jgi:geranylgeranyl pyrophosphate synthase
MVNTNIGVNEKSFEEVLKSVEKRGRPAFEAAKEAILEEHVQNKTVRRALDYYARSLWFDVHHAGLLSLACEAVGGKPDETTLIGAATILLRGGIDVHDDVIDRQEKKMDKLTVYGKYGSSIAILAGDAMLFKGFTLLGEATAPFSREKRRTIMDVVNNAFFEIGDAVADEIEFREDPRLLPKVYYEKVVKGKAVGVEVHMRIGALVGGGTKSEIEALARYGRIFGIVATVRDDLIDMYEPEELQTKIRNECPPLPILYAAKNRLIRKRVDSLLKKKRVTHDDAHEILDITLTSQGYQKLRKDLRKIAKRGMSDLATLKIKGTRNLLLLALAMLTKDL